MSPHLAQFGKRRLFWLNLVEFWDFFLRFTNPKRRFKDSGWKRWFCARHWLRKRWKKWRISICWRRWVFPTEDTDEAMDDVVCEWIQKYMYMWQWGKNFIKILLNNTCYLVALWTLYELIWTFSSDFFGLLNSNFEFQIAIKQVIWVVFSKNISLNASLDIYHLSRRLINILEVTDFVREVKR